jgi:hypothetical protein
LIQKILADAAGKSSSGRTRGDDSDTSEPDSDSDERPTDLDRPYSCCWSH